MSKPEKYKKWVLNDFPSDDFPKDLSCYKYVEEDGWGRQLKEGQIRVKVEYVSVDPVSRVWISGARSYLPPIQKGNQIPSFGLGKVKETKSPLFQEDDYVCGVVTWSEFWVGPATDLQLVPIPIENMYQYLSIYGPTGLTAYISYLEEMKHLKKDAAIVVSSAAGGIGVALFQFLHALGYTNLYGIAGSDVKCRHVEKLGANYCVNYKTEDVTQALRKRIPNGVELFYDNVGEEIMDAVLPVMQNHSKVVMCGATATYTQWKDKLGIKNYTMAIFKRIQFKGILYFGNQKQYAKAFVEIAQLNLAGCEIVIDGLQNAPATLRDNYFGKFIGKPVLRVFYEEKQKEDQDS